MEHYAIQPFQLTKLTVLPAARIGLETTSNTPVSEVHAAFLMIRALTMAVLPVAEDDHMIILAILIIQMVLPCAVGTIGKHVQRNQEG